MLFYFYIERGVPTINDYDIEDQVLGALSV